MHDYPSGEVPLKTISEDAIEIHLVPEEVFVDSPVCPTCDSPERPERLDQITTPSIRADLMMCHECEELFLIMNRPFLSEVKQPLLIRWKFKAMN